VRADGRRNCVTCKKLITRGANGRRKYCSDACGSIARAISRICPVCHNEFKNPNQKTVCCSRKCVRELSDKNRTRHYEEQARLKARRRGLYVKPTNPNPLDAVPNPFAGALNARERAELRVKCDYIRSYISSHNGNMGDNLLSTGRRTGRKRIES
jgi:hypothetical protein